MIGSVMQSWMSEVFLAKGLAFRALVVTLMIFSLIADVFFIML
jgi:hypothetical protein